jgi:hypothetical protein
MLKRHSILIFMLLITIVLTSTPTGQYNIASPSFIEEPQECLSELIPHDSVLITNDADFGTQGWPGNGSESAPYLISNLLFSPSSGTYSLNISGTVTAYYMVANCSVSGHGVADGFSLEAGHAKVIDCNFTQVDIGIALRDIDNATVEGCMINATGTQSAFQIANCQNTMIELCTIWYAGVSAIDSPLTQIAYCSIWDSESMSVDISQSANCTLAGIIVMGGSADGIVIDHCDCAYGLSCIVTGVSGTGLLIVDSYGCIFGGIQSIDNNIGMYLDSVQDSVFTSLSTHHSDESGIVLLATNNCVISTSCSYSNSAHGIEIVSGSSNSLYGNYLGFNTLSAALDNGIANEWNDGGTLGQGNYWDTYSGSGVYMIPGSGGGIDLYPHVWVFPQITPTHAQRFIESGNNDEWVTCYFQGTRPLMCIVMINANIIGVEFLDETKDHKFVLIGAKPVGVYNYSIYVSYECGITLVSSTLVTILPKEGPRINAYEIISGAAGSSVIIRLEVSDRTSIRYVGLTYHVNGVLTYDVNVTTVYDHGVWENDQTTQWCDATLPELLPEGSLVEFQGFAHDDFNMWGSSQVWNFTVGPPVSTTTTTTTTTTETTTTTTETTTTTSTSTTQQTGTLFGDMTLLGIVGGGLIVLLLVALILKKRP